MSDLLAEIQRLSIDERIELLNALWASIDAEAAELTVAQRAELDARLAAYEQDRADVIPWEQVKADLLAE